LTEPMTQGSLSAEYLFQCRTINNKVGIHALASAVPWPTHYFAMTE
jgi:hypothetical protein